MQYDSIVVSIPCTRSIDGLNPYPDILSISNLLCIVPSFLEPFQTMSPLKLVLFLINSTKSIIEQIF